MTLEEASQNINSAVIYLPKNTTNAKFKEYGIITSVNDSFVFVKYGDDTMSKATRACDLLFYL